MSAGHQISLICAAVLIACALASPAAAGDADAIRVLRSWDETVEVEAGQVSGRMELVFDYDVGLAFHQIYDEGGQLIERRPAQRVQPRPLRKSMRPSPSCSPILRWARSSRISRPMCPEGSFWTRRGQILRPTHEMPPDLRLPARLGRSSALPRGGGSHKGQGRVSRQLEPGGAPMTRTSLYIASLRSSQSFRPSPRRPRHQAVTGRANTS